MACRKHFYQIMFRVQDESDGCWYELLVCVFCKKSKRHRISKQQLDHIISMSKVLDRIGGYNK